MPVKAVSTLYKKKQLETQTSIRRPCFELRFIREPDSYNIRAFPKFEAMGQDITLFAPDVNLQASGSFSMNDWM